MSKEDCFKGQWLLLGGFKSNFKLHLCHQILHHLAAIEEPKMPMTICLEPVPKRIFCFLEEVLVLAGTEIHSWVPLSLLMLFIQLLKQFIGSVGEQVTPYLAERRKDNLVTFCEFTWPLWTPHKAPLGSCSEAFSGLWGVALLYGNADIMAVSSFKDFVTVKTGRVSLLGLPVILWAVNQL